MKRCRLGDKARANAANMGFAAVSALKCDNNSIITIIIIIINHHKCLPLTFLLSFCSAFFPSAALFRFVPTSCFALLVSRSAIAERMGVIFKQ
jgi:hypothetical protein